MTSNAKIGLLLGLVIIFVIVFVVNGLSGFDDVGDGDKLSPLAANESTGIKPDLPLEVFSPRRVFAPPPEKTPPPEDKKRFRVQPPATTSDDKTENYTEAVRQSWPKVHIVCEGDNLANIAKKFYGTKEGNKRENVKRIFQANHKTLESPDKIYPGQKLFIPPLWVSVSDKDNLESIFSDSMFEKVDSIGRRHF